MKLACVAVQGARQVVLYCQLSLSANCFSVIHTASLYWTVAFIWGQVSAYEVSFNQFFLGMRFLDKKEKYTLTFCIAEGIM